MKSIRIATTLAVAFAAVLGNAQTFIVQEVSTGGYANAISGGVIGGILGNKAAIWNQGSVSDVNPVGMLFSGINGRNGTLSVGYAGTAALAQSPVIWRGTNSSALTVPFAYVAGRAMATDGLQIVGYATEGDIERGVGATHAMLWNATTGAATDLGKTSTVYGVGGGVQVGTKSGSKGITAGMWRGTLASFVDLHVKGYNTSSANATDGVTQVGYVAVDVRVRNEAKPRTIRFYSACTWNGSAGSINYLPSAYRHSFATGIQGDTIVGYGNTSDAIGTPKDSHAVAWIGDARNYVDLHSMLPADMRTSRATGVDEFGNIVGYGVTTTGVLRSFVWLRN